MELFQLYCSQCIWPWCSCTIGRSRLSDVKKNMGKIDYTLKSFAKMHTRLVLCHVQRCNVIINAILLNYTLCILSVC